MPGSDLRRIGKQSMLKISARTTNGTWLPETDMLTAQSNAAAVSIGYWLSEYLYILTCYSHLCKMRLVRFKSMPSFEN